MVLETSKSEVFDQSLRVRMCGTKWRMIIIFCSRNSLDIIVQFSEKFGPAEYSTPLLRGFTSDHEFGAFLPPKKAIFGLSLVYMGLSGAIEISTWPQKFFSDHKIDKVYEKLWIMSIRHLVQKIFSKRSTPPKIGDFRGGWRLQKHFTATCRSMNIP